MTEGPSSGQGKAMHGGSDGKHAVEYRNPLAKKIAKEIVSKFDNPASLTVEQVATVREELQTKLSQYNTRGQTSEAFGWKEGRLSGHYAEEPEKQAEFAKAIADGSKEKIQQARLEAEAKQEKEAEQVRKDKAAGTIGSAVQGFRDRVKLGQQKVAEQQQRLAREMKESHVSQQVDMVKAEAAARQEFEAVLGKRDIAFAEMQKQLRARAELEKKQRAKRDNVVAQVQDAKLAAGVTGLAQSKKAMQDFHEQAGVLNEQASARSALEADSQQEIQQRYKEMQQQLLAEKAMAVRGSDVNLEQQERAAMLAQLQKETAEKVIDVKKKQQAELDAQPTVAVPPAEQLAVPKPVSCHRQQYIHQYNNN